jgi:hypothetical protein
VLGLIVKKWPFAIDLNEGKEALSDEVLMERHGACLSGLRGASFW